VSSPIEHLFPLPDEIAAIPEGKRGSRVWLDNDFAGLDAKRYVRCRLPLKGTGDFAYVCWVQVSPDQFSLASRLVSDPEVRGKVAFMGILANVLAPFEQDAQVNVNGGMAPGSSRCVARALEGELGAAQSGTSPAELAAILGEVQAPAFEAAVERFLAESWGPLKAAEEFAGKDWRRGPRKITVAEFPAGKRGGGWIYSTLGLSARVMPGGRAGAELVWKASQRVADAATWAEMARTAALPWTLGQGFFHGHLQFYPRGFPPGAPLTSVLFADAARWDERLAGCSVLGRPVNFLKAIPIHEEERLYATGALEEHLSRMLARPIDLQ